MSKIGRNKPCPCGSGKKTKICCGPSATEATIVPGLAEQFNEQGNSLADQGRLNDAIRCYEKALEINPGFAGALNNLGIAFKDKGALERAITCYRQALELSPGFAGAWNNLGNALKEKQSYEEAISCFRHALESAPDSVQVNINLGNILYDLDRHYEVIPCFQRALKCAPDFSIQYKLAYALRATGNNSEAISLCKKALLIKPDSVAVFINMASAYLSQGMIDESIDCYRKALSVDPDFIDTYCGFLMTLQYAYSTRSEELLAEARKYAEKFNGVQLDESRSVKHSLTNGNRLKVGFVSADFRNHPVGYFLECVLQCLDRDSLALVAYANQTVDDSLSERIRPCFESWVAVAEMSDEQLSERIRADGIDLLVDLSGHSSGNRLTTFIRKPAPVQVTWLGYANTTGLRAMDFILADLLTIPLEEEQFYSERVWRLPETYVCFTPPDADVSLGELPALTNGYITFGCFNYPAKINDTVISCWAEILSTVPGSMLLLKYRNFDYDSEQEVFRNRFRMYGIDPDRLRFAGASSREEYLKAYREVDFCLDPFPFPGLTTTCEALWMGVPTLTLRMARGMYGHNGELVMKSVGLDDWVTNSIVEYRDRAIAFAGNLEWLAALRMSLRQALLSSPLCAAERFARNLEHAFQGMVRMSASAETKDRGNNLVPFNNFGNAGNAINLH